jgi:hypothetical protein
MREGERACDQLLVATPAAARYYPRDLIQLAGMNSYHVVFDLAAAGYRAWWFSAWGLLFIAFGIFALRNPKFMPVRGKPRFRKVFLIFWTCFACAWTLGSFYSTFSEYRRLQSAYDRHDYQVVEGRVEDFHPLPWALHGVESFSVKGVTFKYATGLVTAGFNHDSGHGGPIREGLQVRVWYVGNAIIHLEVEENERP